MANFERTRRSFTSFAVRAAHSLPGHWPYDHVDARAVWTYGVSADLRVLGTPSRARFLPRCANTTLSTGEQCHGDEEACAAVGNEKVRSESSGAQNGPQGRAPQSGPQGGAPQSSPQGGTPESGPQGDTPESSPQGDTPERGSQSGPETCSEARTETVRRRTREARGDVGREAGG
jgi:hypothetical protein